MSTKKYHIGYTQGVFDLFHIGHLNLLNNAKKYCDILIAGVNSDKLVKSYKNKQPVIGEDERAEIVRNIKAVDKVFIVDTLDKEQVLSHIKFDAVFIGSDWKNSERWNKTENALKKYNVDVVYLDHTDGISSTLVQKRILNGKNGNESKQ